MELRKRKTEEPVEKFLLHKVVSNSDVEGVRDALTKDSVDVDEKDPKKNTPLYIAVEKGDAKIVKILLDAGADINIKAGPGNSPLHLAVSDNKEEIFKILLDAGADIQTKNNFEKTPLHIAAKNGNKEIIKKLLDAGANVNDINFSGMTPLYEAVCSIFNCKEEIVKLLLGSGADVGIKNWDGDTALQYALDKENFSVASILIEAGLNVNSQNKSGKTVLHFAAMQCKNSIIEWLLSHGIDTNIKDFGQEWTPMHWAAFKNKGTSHLKTIELLAQNGADIYAKNDKGETPFEVLTKKTSDTETLEKFMKCMTNGEELVETNKKKRKADDWESEDEKEFQTKCPKVEKKESPKESLTIADMFRIKTAQKKKEEEDKDVVVVKESFEPGHDTIVDMIRKIKTEVAEIRKEQSENQDKDWKAKLEEKIDEVCKENKDLKKRISSLEAKLKKTKKK